MKVLQINSVCGIRSTGRICTDIAEVLNSNGHFCKIAYGREKVPPDMEKYAYRITDPQGVKLHAIKSRIFDSAGFNSSYATKKFVKWIKNYDPDVIHLHNIHGYYLNVKILFEYLKQAGKPVIWTLHDCWAFTGHCAYFDFADCDKWKTGCFACPQKHKYPESVFLDNSKNNYLAKRQIFTGMKDLTLVTPSRWLANLTRESFLKNYPVRVIQNGIDLNVFRPSFGNFKEKNNLNGKTVFLGVASTWDERKGLKDFLKLSKIVSPEVKIVLVGLNESQMRSLPENIIGISQTNSTKELAEIYTAADVFLNPTYEDNFPTTNLEAIACGTHVVTYNTGGSPESVDENTGAVVEKGNVNAMYKAALECSAKKFNFENAAKKFDKQINFKKYLELYSLVTE